MLGSTPAPASLGSGTASALATGAAPGTAPGVTASGSTHSVSSSSSARTGLPPTATSSSTSSASPSAVVVATAHIPLTAYLVGKTIIQHIQHYQDQISRDITAILTPTESILNTHHTFPASSLEIGTVIEFARSCFKSKHLQTQANAVAQIIDKTFKQLTVLVITPDGLEAILRLDPDCHERINRLLGINTKQTAKLRIQAEAAEAHKTTLQHTLSRIHTLWDAISTKRPPSSYKPVPVKNIFGYESMPAPIPHAPNEYFDTSPVVSEVPGYESIMGRAPYTEDPALPPIVDRLCVEGNTCENVFNRTVARNNANIPIFRKWGEKAATLRGDTLDLIRRMRAVTKDFKAEATNFTGEILDVDINAGIALETCGEPSTTERPIRYGLKTQGYWAECNLYSIERYIQQLLLVQKFLTLPPLSAEDLKALNLLDPETHERIITKKKAVEGYLATLNKDLNTLWGIRNSLVEEIRAGKTDTRSAWETGSVFTEEQFWSSRDLYHVARYIARALFNSKPAPKAIGYGEWLKISAGCKGSLEDIPPPGNPTAWMEISGFGANFPIPRETLFDHLKKYAAYKGNLDNYASVLNVDHTPLGKLVDDWMHPDTEEAEKATSALEGFPSSVASFSGVSGPSPSEATGHDPSGASSSSSATGSGAIPRRVPATGLTPPMTGAGPHSVGRTGLAPPHVYLPMPSMTSHVGGGDAGGHEGKSEATGLRIHHSVPTGHGSMTSGMPGASGVRGLPTSSGVVIADSFGLSAAILPPRTSVHFSIHEGAPGSSASPLPPSSTGMTGSGSSEDPFATGTDEPFGPPEAFSGVDMSAPSGHFAISHPGDGGTDTASSSSSSSASASLSSTATATATASATASTSTSEGTATAAGTTTSTSSGVAPSTSSASSSLPRVSLPTATSGMGTGTGSGGTVRFVPPPPPPPPPALNTQHSTTGGVPAKKS